MLVEVAFEGEGLAAPLADVRLAAGVRLYVSPQVGLVGERLPADGAGEGLLARVGSYVSLQQPGSAEALPAVGALAALAVRPHVHAVGRHRHVHLVAVRTFARLLVGHTSVGLPVSRQVARGAVPLAALAADVVVLRVADVRGRAPARAAVRGRLLHQLTDDCHQGGCGGGVLAARPEEGRRRADADCAVRRGRRRDVVAGVVNLKPEEEYL